MHNLELNNKTNQKGLGKEKVKNPRKPQTNTTLGGKNTKWNHKCSKGQNCTRKFIPQKSCNKMDKPILK